MEDTTTAVVDSSPAPIATEGATSPEVSTPATPAERPTSMRDAFEKVAAKRAATGTAAPTAPPALTQPDGTTSPAREPGPIPFKDHQRILDNARAKEAERIGGEWKDYEWVRQVPASDLRSFAERAISAKGDPIAFLKSLADEIAADPVHGQALRSFAAKQLAAGRTDAEPQPDVTIDDGQGGVAGYTYSAAQLAKREAWLERQFMAKIDARLGPLQQSHDHAVQAQARAEKQAQAQEWSGGFSKEIGQYRGFAEHKTEIGRDVLAQLQQLPKNDPRGDDPAFLEAATLRAYHRVVGPKLPALIQAQLSASLKQKAVAQTESPSRATPSSGQRPRGVKELAKLLESKAAERGR